MVVSLKGAGYCITLGKILVIYLSQSADAAVEVVFGPSVPQHIYLVGLNTFSDYQQQIEYSHNCTQ